MRSLDNSHHFWYVWTSQVGAHTATDNVFYNRLHRNTEYTQQSMKKYATDSMGFWAAEHSFLYTCDTILHNKTTTTSKTYTHRDKAITYNITIIYIKKGSSKVKKAWSKSDISTDKMDLRVRVLCLLSKIMRWRLYARASVHKYT